MVHKPRQTHIATLTQRPGGQAVKSTEV